MMSPSCWTALLSILLPLGVGTSATLCERSVARTTQNTGVPVGVNGNSCIREASSPNAQGAPLNLLVNGYQAIDGPGTLRITTRYDERNIHVQICDDGCGIPEENLSKLFDPGFTTKGVGVGTGLGLSICYQIVQEHHGEIQVQSQLTRGSCFEVILPRQ